MKTTRFSAALTSAVLMSGAMVSCGDDGTVGDDGVTAAFETPTDGARLAGGVPVTMTADGIVIEPAGEAVDGAGHFHVIADGGCVAAGAVIARDADHVHFGSGADVGTIYLEPGRHSLCLQVGDGAHTATDATNQIEIEVGIGSRDDWCKVVGEVDGLLNKLDASQDEFTVKQLGYENAGRLFAQLTAAPEFVDADARAAVSELIGLGSLMAETIIAADSEQAAIEQLFESPDSPFAGEHDPVGATWVSDACGVGIDQ
jgi:hypothetical protein